MAVLAVTATMACSHGFAGDATAGERAAATKLVLAHYMPWYETPEVRGAWGGHWRGFEPPLHDPSQNGPDGLPDIYSHYHPLIGPYDSTDPALVECHLAQMKLAGIDGVVVDWYGVAEAFDFPVSHGGSVAVCDAISRYGMRFAACYEDRIMKMLADQGLLGSGGAEERLREDIGWLSKHWFSRPEYLRVGGRPLLMNFGPIQVTEPAPWAAAFADLPQQPAFFALHHLWRKVGADGGFTWIHWEPWKGEADDDAVRAELERTFKLPSSDPKQVIASAVAGYDDVYKRPNPRLDHRDGKTLRQSLDAALASPVEIVQLVTWNDYGEGTMIEPTHEFGYTFLEVVQEATRRHRGDKLPYTAADLRLPEKLYRARKAGRLPRERLDQAAAALARGDCTAARLTLENAD